MLLRAHALPLKVAASCLKLLLSTVLDHPNLLSTEALDLSPILWTVKLTSTLSARTQVVDCLCYNGAHSEFLRADVARSMGLELKPVSGQCSVCLPQAGGTLIKVLHQVTLTVKIDQQYKGDVTLWILQLKGMGAILGMPWLNSVGAVTDHADKTVWFEQHNSTVVLLPSNQVWPTQPLEPRTAAGLPQFEPGSSGYGRADEEAHALVWPRRVQGVPGRAGGTRHPTSWAQIS
eukprot:1213080-Rhodomonas_salina.1